MRALFLVYTLLEADVAHRVAAELLKLGGVQPIVFNLRLREFGERFPWMVERIAELGVAHTSAEDFPNHGPVAVMRSIQPDVISTTDDHDPVYMPYLIAARSRGIPILLIQPGIISETPFSIKTLKIPFIALTRLRRIMADYRAIWSALKETGDTTALGRVFFICRDLWFRFSHGSGCWGHGICDRIAVSGAFLKDILARRGVSSEKIVITGQPRFDQVYLANARGDPFFPKLEEMRGGRKVVLYLPDASYQHLFQSKETYEETTRRTIEACGSMANILLVIKPHPGEDPAWYRGLVESCGVKGLVYEGPHLHPLIRASDAVITGTSTTGLEALMLCKPLVIVNLCNGKSFMPTGYEYIPYIQDGVALGITMEQEFVPTIRAALASSGDRELATRSQAFVHYHCYLQDGKASARVAKLLVETGHNKQKSVRVNRAGLSTIHQSFGRAESSQ